MAQDRAPDEVVADLLAEHGTTYAAQAGITLRDEPAPLFQLLVLSMLSAARISADVAAASARELFEAGWRTPAAMRAATWQQRVDALGRGGYRRLDESTSRYLDEAAGQLQETLHGDLRRLRPRDGRTVADLERDLRRFPRIGPTGAAIFSREVQAVWPEVRPRFDRRGLASARDLGLPTEPAALAALVDGDQVAVLSAALVRRALHHG